MKGGIEMTNNKLFLTGFLILLFSCLTGFSQSHEMELQMGNKANLQEKNDNQKQEELTYVKVVHFTVKQDRKEEFFEWMKQNQDDFARSLPPGWKFLGCYYTVFHTGKHGCQFRYEIEGMSAYDTLVLFESEKLDKYWEIIYGFIDRQIPMEMEILKEIKSDNKTVEN